MFRLDPPSPRGSATDARCEHTETSPNCSAYVADTWCDIFDPRTWNTVPHDVALEAGLISDAGYIQHGRVRDAGYVVRKVRRQCGHGGTWYSQLDMRLCSQHAKRLAEQIDSIVRSKRNEPELVSIAAEHSEQIVADVLAKGWAA